MDEEFDCPHIAEAAVNVNVDVEKMRATLSSRSCNVCLRIDQLWMCMECKQILCGHIALGHTTAHFTFLNKHCLYINIESAAIYCYLCDSEVEPKHHDDELNRLRQFILYNQGPTTINRNRRRQPAPKVIPPKKACLKRGPRTAKTVAITKNGTKRSNNATKKTYSEPVKKTPEAKIVQKIVPVKSVKTKTPAKPKRRKARRGVTKRRTYKAPTKALAVVKPKPVAKVIKPKKVVIKRGPRTNKKVGISNSGNNCFMNAVWQALRHLKPFVYCLKLFKFHDNNVINNNHSNSKKENISISDELLKLMLNLIDWKKPPNYKARDSVSPTALHALVCKIKPRYKGFHQHDAHEFLMFTLDTLHSELRDEKYRLLLEEGNGDENPGKIDTLVSLLFRGYLLSEVVCLNCKSVFKKSDPFTDISLDVPDYKHAPLEPHPEDLITDCLERYIEVEELNGSNAYLCSTCNSQQKITKRFYINNLPNILCLQLKRFRWDNVYRTKVHTHVKFPTQSLDMSKYLDEEMKKTTKEGAYMFDLSSIIVHAGEGSGSGHYTTYAVDDKEEQWYEYNDEKVHEVGEPMVESVQAYILIYIKREVKLNLCL